MSEVRNLLGAVDKLLWLQLPAVSTEPVKRGLRLWIGGFGGNQIMPRYHTQSGLPGCTVRNVALSLCGRSNVPRCLVVPQSQGPFSPPKLCIMQDWAEQLLIGTNNCLWPLG